MIERPMKTRVGIGSGLIATKGCSEVMALPIEKQIAMAKARRCDISENLLAVIKI
jgi:hypothetical protein